MPLNKQINCNVKIRRKFMKKVEYKYDYEECVNINGNKQNIRIRSNDFSLPVLLFVHGGPGVCDRHWVLGLQSSLTEVCTMVCWDQRASGKSYSKESCVSTLTLDVYIEDLKELIEYLCTKFDKPSVSIIGHSWGSIIGALTAYKYPEKINYYVGMGQFVDGEENERISYEFCLNEAEKRKDKKAISKLLKCRPVNGEYPSHDAMMTQRDYLTRYGGADYKHRGGIISSLLIPLLKSPEYKIPDIVKYAKGGMKLTAILWKDVVSRHFKTEIPELKMPVLITQGKHDYNTPLVLAKDWFDNLKAPIKNFIVFPESAHSPIKEEPEKWNLTIKKYLFKENIKTPEINEIKDDDKSEEKELYLDD